MDTYKTIVMKPGDSVATALVDIPAGAKSEVGYKEKKIVTLKDPISFGHKFAIKEIQSGEDIIKYGEVIGAAVCTIEIGKHVHVHNLEGKRGRGDLGA